MPAVIMPRPIQSTGDESRLKVIVTESIFSMDGEHAPLWEIAQIAKNSNALLIVDEAHATGVFGPDGRGLAAELEGSDHVLVLHTGGKALGVSGAIVTGPSVLCDFLINRGRPFIFATAPPPLVATALCESMAILREEPERRTRLASLAAHARQAIRKQLDLPTPHSQILPVIIGESDPAIRIAEMIQTAGFDVRAIRPPTVPAGTARLRISITLHLDESSIDALVYAMREAMFAMTTGTSAR